MGCWQSLLRTHKFFQKHTDSAPHCDSDVPYSICRRFNNNDVKDLTDSPLLSSIVYDKAALHRIIRTYVYSSLQQNSSALSAKPYCKCQSLGENPVVVQWRIGPSLQSLPCFASEPWLYGSTFQSSS